MIGRLIPAVLLVLGWNPSALAQQLSPARADTREDSFSEGKAVVGASGPLDRAAAATSRSALEFNSTQGDTEATLALSFSLAKHRPVPAENPGTYRMSDLNLVVKASVPVNKESDNSRIFTGDHLVSGSRITLALTRTSSLQKDGRDLERQLPQVIIACVDSETKKWAGSDETKLSIINEYLKALNARGPYKSPARLDGVISHDLEFVSVTLSDHIKEKCLVHDPIALAGEYRPDLVDALEKAAFVTKAMHFLGVDGSYGRKEFKALSRSDFAVSSIDKNDWELGAYFGLIGPTLDWSLRLRGVYGRVHESPDEVQFCRATAEGTGQECISGPDGNPVSSKTGLVSIEGRRLFKLTDGQKIGFSPQVTYDIKDKSFRAEVPVYLSPDKDGALSGGIKFGYNSKSENSKKDDFAIGLFVGLPFSIFY